MCVGVGRHIVSGVLRVWVCIVFGYIVCVCVCVCVCVWHLVYVLHVVCYVMYRNCVVTCTLHDGDTISVSSGV